MKVLVTSILALGFLPAASLGSQVGHPTDEMGTALSYIRCAAWAGMAGLREENASLMEIGVRKAAQGTRSREESLVEEDVSVFLAEGPEFYAGVLVGSQNILAQADISIRVPQATGIDDLAARSRAIRELAAESYNGAGCATLVP